jgi:alginate O-acetyltransferase complex protein AlgJ
MLRSYRRYWFLVLTALLTAPLVLGLFDRSGEEQFSAEKRRGADWPGFPRSSAAWIALPKQIETYLGDHFGLRSELIQARAIVAHHVLGDCNEKVLEGRGGRLFFRLDDMLQQSAGLLVREPLIQGSAEAIASIHATLAAKGIRFIFASPPNSSTIYSRSLPGWARNQGVQTEYDLLLRALEERGVPVADLRPPLNEARDKRLLAYRKLDTHWTYRGALIAFNAVASAAGHPDWVLDAETALGPVLEMDGGDLADMLGLRTYLKEQIELSVLPSGEEEALDREFLATFQSTLHAEKSGTLMIIGDSFTHDFFSPMALANVGRFAWTHHQLCGFDWQWVEKFRPDEVWYMPTERAAFCTAKPTGMPQAPEHASLGADSDHSH